MVCIYCSNPTKVTNSRHQKRQNRVWRRRQCTNCQAVFSSLEHADLLGSLSVVSGKDLQPFSRDKLFISLYESLKHRKTALGDATELTGTIISRLYPLISNASLEKQQIAKTSHSVLQSFDQIAATHYGAFHITT